MSKSKFQAKMRGPHCYRVGEEATLCSWPDDIPVKIVDIVIGDFQDECQMAVKHMDGSNRWSLLQHDNDFWWHVVETGLYGKFGYADMETAEEVEEEIYITFK